MSVPFDECVPRKFKARLSGRQVRTVPEAGLAGFTNGELLTAAESLGFEVFQTIDRGIEYQQSFSGRIVGVLIVQAKTNQLDDLL